MNLTNIAIVSIVISFICSTVVIIDIINGHQQKMWIMNIVWPVTLLYSGPIGLWAYFKIGRKDTKKEMQKKQDHSEPGERNQQENKKVTWKQVVKGTLHCGSGCTLGDITAETLLLFIPFVVFGSKLYGAWIIDYVFAFLLGIIFQYYSIKPMKNLSSSEALKAALKADHFL